MPPTRLPLVFDIVSKAQSYGSVRTFGVPQALYPHYHTVFPVNDHLLTYARDPASKPFRRLSNQIVAHAHSAKPSRIPQSLAELVARLPRAERAAAKAYSPFAIQYLGADIAVHTHIEDQPIIFYWPGQFIDLPAVRQPTTIYAYVEQVDNQGAMRNWKNHHENRTYLDAGHRLTSALRHLFDNSSLLYKWCLAIDKTIAFLYQSGSSSGSACAERARLQEPSVSRQTPLRDFPEGRPRRGVRRIATWTEMEPASQ